MSYDDEHDDEDFGINDIEKKLEDLQKLFCDTIYDDIKSGGYVETDDIKECIIYFASREEYEKCILLKKALLKNSNTDKTLF